jgi:DNA primase
LLAGEVAAVGDRWHRLTEEQRGRLLRQHPEPTLSFDGDKAGLRAAHRAVDTALPLLQPGRSLRFALLTEGQDPDDLLRDKGPAALRDALYATRPLVDVLWERERLAAEPLDTPERRAGLKARLRQLAAAIAEPDLSGAYKQELLSRYDGLWAPTVDERSRAASTLSRARWTGRGKGAKPLPGGASAEGRAAARRISETVPPLTAAVAVGLLAHPAAPTIISSPGRPGFRHPACRRWRRRSSPPPPRPPCSTLPCYAAAWSRRAETLLQRLEAAAARSGVAAPFLDPALPRRRPTRSGRKLTTSRSASPRWSAPSTTPAPSWRATPTPPP